MVIEQIMSSVMERSSEPALKLRTSPTRLVRQTRVHERQMLMPVAALPYPRLVRFGCVFRAAEKARLGRSTGDDSRRNAALITGA